MHESSVLAQRTHDPNRRSRLSLAKCWHQPVPAKRDTYLLVVQLSTKSLSALNQSSLDSAFQRWQWGSMALNMPHMSSRSLPKPMISTMWQEVPCYPRAMGRLRKQSKPPEGYSRSQLTQTWLCSHTAHHFHGVVYQLQNLSWESVDSSSNSHFSHNYCF